MAASTVRPNLGLSLPLRNADMMFTRPSYSLCFDLGRSGGQLLAAKASTENTSFSPEMGSRKTELKPANCVSNETENWCVASAAESGNERFVGWFHQAWPYIRGHRGSTFVVVISSEIVDNPELLEGILQDLSLLHGLGIKFVIVPGTQLHIDRLLAQRGREGKYVGRYRVTDSDSLKAAMEAAGTAQHTIQSKLSPGPPILSLRRHGDNKRWHDVGVRVVSGNFLAAKRRGVVDGTDYGATGEVKKIDVTQIRERLEADCIVLVSNLGYSSSGEVLNCNMYEVATACALAIEADKMICFMDGPICDKNERLIRFLSFQDADKLIRQRAEQSEIAANYVKAVSEDDSVSPRTLVNGIRSLKKM